MQKKSYLCIVLNWRRIGLWLVLSVFAFASQAKENTVPSRIKSWRLPSSLAIADTVGVDTSFVNYPLRSVLNDYSIANSYNGNVVSPVQSKLFFLRHDKLGFLFANAYTPFILTTRDVQFYNTTTPFSNIAYRRSFKTYHEEHDIDFSFTGNLNRRTNLGMTINYLSGIGMYESQSGKSFRGSLFGSYHGDHYGLQAAITFNQLKNFENGGVQTEEDVQLGTLNSYDIPVRLNAMSGFRHIDALWNHHYSICVERDRKEKIKPPRGSKEEPRDTIITEYVPVTTFMHTFEVNQSVKRYIEQRADQSFYEHTYFDEAATSDTANVLNIRNTLAVTFEEEFNKWLHFGAMVYAINEFQRFAYNVPEQNMLFDSVAGISMEEMLADPLRLQTDTCMGHKWVNNTWVGGSIYKNQGKWVRFGVTGDVCLAGYKLGEFQVNGHVNGEFPIGKDTLLLKAKAYVKNQTPDWFMQHYRSNHFCWDNDFGKVYRFYVGGEVAYPMKYVQPKVKVGFENLTRYIYFGEDGLPVQHDGNIQVVAVDANLNIRTKRFGMDNNVVWQMSSSDVLPLPMLTLYHNIYYKDCWFRALDVQMGADLRYHTAYYAPVLNPATGQFCVQDDKKVGNYPMIGLYLNFNVRPIRLRFFGHISHLNGWFMKNRNYYSMPLYPMNPPEIRAGLAWNFYK